MALCSLNSWHVFCVIYYRQLLDEKIRHAKERRRSLRYLRLRPIPDNVCVPQSSTRLTEANRIGRFVYTTWLLPTFPVWADTK